MVLDIDSLSLVSLDFSHKVCIQMTILRVHLQSPAQSPVAVPTRLLHVEQTQHLVALLPNTLLVLRLNPSDLLLPNPQVAGQESPVHHLLAKPQNHLSLWLLGR